MAWQRRWRIDSREKLRRITGALGQFSIDLQRHPIELIVREATREKSPQQRALFHAVCADLAAIIGEWPASVKRDIKQIYYGEAFSSEDLDHEEYGGLIECAYVTAAQLGIHLPDRRRQ